MLRSVTESTNALSRFIPGSDAFIQWRSTLTRRNFRRRALHAGLLLLNVFLVGAALLVIVLNPSHVSSKANEAVSTDNVLTTQQPLDALASVNIALTVARMAALPEAGAVLESANSASIQLAVSSTNNAIVNKPQAVSSAYVSNKDIHSYTALAGDSVDSIATKFGLSANSVLWSNGLTGVTLVAGKKLDIPPVNGIVYTVKDGDTAASLATKYRSSEEKIIAYNDAEVGGLKPGEKIIIPDGQIIATARPVYYSAASGFAWGSDAVYGYNGYAWGNCTWYVATQVAVPANWGNAATWAAGARAAGWHVSSIPTVGSIAQNSWMAGGLGHVALVDGVSPDGKQVLIRDMNGIAGFDRVGVAWEPVSLFTNYITR